MLLSCAALMLVAACVTGQPNTPPHILLLQRMLKSLPTLISAQSNGKPEEVSQVWNNLLGNGILKDVLQPENVQTAINSLLQNPQLRNQRGFEHQRQPIVLGGRRSLSLNAFDTTNRGDTLFTSNGGGLFGAGSRPSTSQFGNARLPLLPRHDRLFKQRRQNLFTSNSRRFNQPSIIRSPVSSQQSGVALLQPSPISLPNAAELVSRLSQQLLRPNRLFQTEATTAPTATTVTTVSTPAAVDSTVVTKTTTSALSTTTAKPIVRSKVPTPILSPTVRKTKGTTPTQVDDDASLTGVSHKISTTAPPTTTAKAGNVEFTPEQIAQLQQLLTLLQSAQRFTNKQVEEVLTTTTSSPRTSTTISRTTNTHAITTTPTVKSSTTPTKKSTANPATSFSIDRTGNQTKSSRTLEPITPLPFTTPHDTKQNVPGGCICMAVDMRMMEGTWIQAFGNPDNLRMIYQGVHRLRHPTVTTAAKPQCVSFKFGKPKQNLYEQSAHVDWNYQLPSVAEIQRVPGTITARDHRMLMIEMDQLGGFKFTFPLCVIKAESGSDGKYEYMVLVETIGADKCRSAHVLVRTPNRLFHPTHEPLISYLKQRVASGLMKPLIVLPLADQCDGSVKS